MHVDVAGHRCYFTFKLIRVRQVIRPVTSETSRTAEGSDENVRNVIRHCLEFDLGRSVGVTTTTQLVWLTQGLRAHSQQQPCNQKDTRLKICK